jgi:hypothetical protein
MAARPILETFPGIWYITPLDGSVIICASDNYLEKERGVWHQLPPMLIEGGLLVNWMVKA